MLLMIGVFLMFIFLCWQWKEDWRESLLTASIIMGGLFFIGTEVLSLFGAINQTGLILYWAVWLAALAVYILLNRKQWKQPAISLSFTALLWIDRLLIIGAAGLVLLNIIIAIQASPNNWDSMVYHLPRVMHWLSNGTVNHYATHVHRQLFMNPGMEYLLLQLIGLSGGDEWVHPFGLLIWLGGAILASLLAKKLGAEERAQWMTAVICLLIPTAILQAGTPKNDLLLGYWVLAAIIHGFQFVKKPSFINAALLGGVIGLAILTKSTAYVLLAPLVIWLIVRGFQAAGKKMWQYGVLITLIVAVLAVPQMLRNYSVYGSPLGPSEEIDYYHNEIYGLRVLASNSIRNLSIHLRGPEAWSNAVMKGVDWFHHLIGIDASDPRTTWVGYTYDVKPIRFTEDDLGAPLHLVFFVLAMVMMIFTKDKHNETFHLLSLVTMMLVAVFLLFSAYLRWQLWQARLMISMMMIASVVIGVVIGKKKFAWLSTAMVGLMLLFGMLSIYKNPTKHLPFNVLYVRRRMDNVFVVELKQEYIIAMKKLSNDLECSQLGIVMDNGDWEYPFWTLTGGDVRIEHVMVTNQSAFLMDEDFSPCAVIVMTEDRPPDVILPTGDGYFPYLDTKELAIYVP